MYGGQSINPKIKEDIEMFTVQIGYYSSCCGDLMLGTFEGRLCICDWLNKKKREIIDKRMQYALDARYEVVTPSGVLAEAIVQMDEYFTCKRTVFDVPLLFTGTDFQKSVWRELLHIPYGTTISYGELSAKLGNPRAVRAVAAANAANPLSIFVPCHRVIGSSHRLVGYSGGLEAKRKLLDLEAL